MRNALAVALGALVGLLLPALAIHVVHPAVASGAATLSWEVGRPLASFGAGPQATALTGALAGALGVPALLAAIAEAVGAGRGPRRAGTIVLAGIAIGSLGAHGLPVGPFFVAAIVGAVLLALAPGRWASVPISVAVGAVAWVWWRQIVGAQEFLTPAAKSLANTLGGSAGAWTLALAWISGGLIVAGIFSLMRRPARSS